MFVVKRVAAEFPNVAKWGFLFVVLRFLGGKWVILAAFWCFLGAFLHSSFLGQKQGFEGKWPLRLEGTKERFLDKD